MSTRGVSDDASRNRSSGMSTGVYVNRAFILESCFADCTRQRKWPEERIPIGLEPLPGFNLRAEVVGHGGAYVKHIQQETRCRVQIKGRGSAYYENATQQESDDPMFLHVA